MIFNAFRVLGDVSHIVSKIILMWSIHWNRSAEGVSLITQVLYVLVFLTRYLDLFESSPFQEWLVWWNFCFKVFYILSSGYIVFLMMFVYARTREREKAWKFGLYCLGAGLVLAMPMCKIFEQGPKVIVDGHDVFLYRHPFTFREILWTFSEILESVCVLPQLLLLRQTTVPTVIDSYYLICLGSYRAFYILNWIVRAADKHERYFDPITVIFGIIQTALYLDFAWVYYSRQRVKLRGGGIVDSDDLERGWLVGRLVGKHGDANEDDDDDERLGDEDGVLPQGQQSRQKRNTHVWGARGISVSADEAMYDDSRASGEDGQSLAEPSAFEDDLSDEEGESTSRKDYQVGGQSPWTDEDRK